MKRGDDINLYSTEETSDIIRLSSSSDVVTMALQMSPVDAHSSVNLVDELLPALQASTTTTINIAGMSSQAELPQCQLMECSSAEQQVPLPIEQEPCSSLRGTEQNVTAALQEEEEEVDVMASALAKNEERRIPRDEELRGGAAPEILASLKVSQSSVIVSSKTAASLSSAEVSSVAGSHEAHPGSHESHLNLHPCRLVDVVKMDSAATSSSFSNSLNDAQKDVGDGLMNDGDPSPTRSVNQSTSTFSGETNHPSATYADSVLSTSSSPIPASSSLVSNLSSSFTSPPAHSAASAFDGDYCDSKETFDITLKSSSSISSRTSPLLHYTHPTGPASNRFWGIPQGAGLRGGAGETSLNNGAGTWGHPPASGTWGGGAPGGGAGPTGGSGTNNATNPVVQGQGWGSAGSSAAARSSAASQGPPGAPPPGSSGPQPISSNSQQLSAGGQQQQTPQGAWDQPKTVAQVLGSSPNQGVWAAQAAKNVPNQPTNPNQDIINAGPLNLPQGGNGGGGAMGGSGPATPSSGKPDPLANYREVIYSQDGWGGNQVNQDTQWDVPTSPEPKEIPLWKQTASNGTEVWEVNLRNGGLAPPPIPQTKTPWGSHTPATNLGGTWGEDDESAEPSSMWTGVPSNNGPNNWAGNPMGAPMGGGPMGGGPAPGGAPGMTGAGMSGPGMTGPGMAAGNGMWGGPKKEPEWAGNSNTMQAGPAGWGDIRPTQRIGMPGPETMGMGGPGAPSHWPGAQNKAVPGQWSGGVPPVKEMKPSGWDENSPPAQKRPIHNYDDGTAVWGNPTQQMQQQPGSRWKDMPNPNVAGGRGGMQQTGPPPGRMPPGPGMKTDMSWGGVGQTRNGSWGDGVSDQGTMWMDDKPMGVGTASWNEPPQTPTPWAKPKTPTTPSWGGGDNDDGSLSWGQPPKQMGPKPLAKEMIWASKQFRILSDMGFKKEDVENVLRNCNMVMEDALETLRSGRLGMFGEDHGGSGGGYDGMGPHGGGAPYPPTNRFNPAQQMPFGHPGGGGAAHHLLSNPSSGMGINPNQAYKILQPQQPPPMPPQVNPAQLVRNMGGRVDSGVSSGGGGSGTGSQPSPTQLRILVQQIQMAVQAGHLNPQILNQPLAPQTLVLLNQLLHQIKILQQLGQQHTMALGRPGGSGPGMMQLVPQMNKTKQQIASLQQQIAAQQALYVKQQGGGGGGMMNQQPPGAPPGSQGSELFKVDQVHNLQSNLERMNLQQDSGQSRLSQWKYPPMDSMDVIGMSDFSRAPGSIGGGAPPGNIKPPLGSSLSSPNMNPVLGQDGSAWGSLSRSQSETGWPDSGSDLPLGEGKDNWSSGATGTSSYSGSISDLVPEFEPGKPWKGPQIKTADDDPTLTPGTFAMSGLNNESDAYSNNGSKSGGNNPSSKSSPPPVSSSGGSSGGSSGSGGGFPTLGLSNSTWSFNPSSASSAATSSSGGAPYGSVAKSGPPKTTWSDAPPPLADPWSAPNKPRGPPPGITTASSGSQGSSGGSRSPWPGSGPSAGSSAGSWAGSLNGSSSWLVLRNLTPQIDGSTLKTLCVQHGPLHNFHLYLSHGVALVRYSTGEEAAKAQSALNNCVLGNTTIYADLANESDVQGWLQQLGMPTQQQQQQQQPGSSSGGNWGVRGSTPGAGGNGTSGGNGNGGGSGGNTGKASANSAGDNNWGASGAGGGSGGGGGGGGGPTSSSPWSTGPSSVWSTPSLDREMRTTPSSLNASLNSFLPGDLLGNESM